MVKSRLALLMLLLICMASRSTFAQRVLRGQPVRPVPPPIQISGCPSERAAATSANIGPDDFVELRRSSCFGSCPVYTVRVHADGRVRWRGEQYVRIATEDTGTIDPADARALIEKFSAMDGWNLCSSYSVPVTDAPTVTTTFHIGLREKQISDYMNSAPGWLQELEYDVDAVADTHRWIHGDPRTESLAMIRVPGVVASPANRVSPGLESDFRGPKPGLTPLMQAAAKGDVATIRAQLQAGADPNAQDSSGWTALMYAAPTNTSDAMKTLLEAGANPNIRSYMDQTAAMAVSNAFNAPLEKLKLLLAARADINAQDREGHTALMFAMYGLLTSEDGDRQFREKVELISTMRQAGAQTDLHDTAGLTVFDYLDDEARRYADKKNQAERFRQILQNP